MISRTREAKEVSMERRDFLKLSVGAGASLWLTGFVEATATGHKKPNIVLIVSDELGYYELSCMGHRIMETPNIDRLAANEGKEDARRD